MPLILKLINTSQNQQPQSSFSEQGGSIGRSSENTWCIKGNFISRKHALIEFSVGTYYLIDCSTNGVELKSHPGLIKKGAPYEITNGDIFQIGEFEVLARIEADKVESRSHIDPYASPTPLSEYIKPNVERFAEINDPIRFPESRGGAKTPSPPERKAHSAESFEEDLFQVSQSHQTSSPESNNQLIDQDFGSDENDLAIFSVGGSLPPETKTEEYKEPLYPDEPIRKELDESHSVSTSFAEKLIEPAVGNMPLSKQSTVELYEKILAGAGIPTNKTPPPDIEEFYRLTGAVLHECIQGIIDLLKSRTEVKGHLRLDRTIIGQGTETNPLKFMPNAEQVMLHSLISDSQSGYLPIIEAIQEAVDDLKAHQFAMSMSVQDALKTTIQHHFSPQKIRSKLEKDRSILNKIPLQREAKLWSMFEALYSEIEQEASETFELLLEREIAKAYKLHSMELNYHRKVQKRQK